ncbi:sulfurtransferase TusA family protein, partial [Acidianus sp. RZ1]|uniref:sulfurtransferase TusA family protein n=1 Tax=Acidianus sp. RZ1 TaxID=1540082 RepID=UPI001492558F
MKANIYNDSYEPLLDLRKSWKFYLLKDLKALDYGYVARFRWLGKDYWVFAWTTKDSVKILEENGKFSITVTFSNIKGKITAELEYEGIASFASRIILGKITKNLEEYSKYLHAQTNSSSGSVLLMNALSPRISKTLDLRGSTCPIPEIETKKAILKSSPYDVIEVLTDHPAAIFYTLPEVAKVFNCRYEVRNKGDYASFIIYLSRMEWKEDNFSLEDIKNLIRNEGSLARLYVYFDKIEKQKTMQSFSPEILNYPGLTLIVAASQGRGWLLTAIENDGKLLAARLERGNTKLFDDDAVNDLSEEEGTFNV